MKNSYNSSPAGTAPHVQLRQPARSRVPARPGPTPSTNTGRQDPPGLARPGARRLRPAPLSGHSAVTSWSRPPDAGAVQPIGGCHTAARAGLGGWDLRLPGCLGQTRERRLRACGFPPASAVPAEP
ncbi:hypothetical protein J1605_015083 [Eschrichtius robustus]|uniref:Uncharacterized protein n=1 Tax=Eschrichtius robustus TaxID=9764 RepID=A0AB34GAS4_ESCRO|nr:hypothetical protein J1605_015083 [Eschrichtius robustus]